MLFLLLDTLTCLLNQILKSPQKSIFRLTFTGLSAALTPVTAFALSTHPPEQQLLVQSLTVPLHSPLRVVFSGTAGYSGLMEGSQ